MSLTSLWDRLPQRVRDAVGRFVKVISGAAVLAVGDVIVRSITGGVAITAPEIGTAVLLAVASAVEKYFNFAPKVAAKVRKKG